MSRLFDGFSEADETVTAPPLPDEFPDGDELDSAAIEEVEGDYLASADPEAEPDDD